MNTHDKLRVGVVFGGRSGEHEISLLSARSVIEALNPEKYYVTQIGITHEGAWFVGNNVLDAMVEGRHLELNPATLLPDPTRKGLFTLLGSQKGEILKRFEDLDVVFPLIHGTFGEDGTIQGLLEMAEMAYVGAGVLGSSLGMDKAVFKDVMRSNQIPVVDSLTFSSKGIRSNPQQVLEHAETVSPYPLFVKPVNLGSSVGISKCRNRSGLVEGLLDAARYDRRVLVERGVNAREIEVSVLGNDKPAASIPGEIIPSDEFYSYNAKYHDDRSQLLIPAPLSEDLKNLAQDLAMRCFLATDCAGMARVDFLLDKDTNALFVNEINTIPGFTRISMYPKLWNATGISYPMLVDRLIELAMERKVERDQIERRYSHERSGG